MRSELGRRIAFTLGALLVYRIGSYIPLPGIDPSVWARIFGANAGGVLGLFNMASGGAAGRLGVFALGITPFLTAAILLQLVMFVSSKLRALRNGGDRGRSRLVRYTLILTILLTLFQAYGVAGALEDVRALVPHPGPLFLLTTTVTLAGGSLFVVWLADQITLRGIGNGIALVLFAGVVTELPTAVDGTFELGRQGVLSTANILVVVVLAMAVIGFVVFMELGRRRLPVQYAARQVGMADSASHLTLKLNSAGVIPVLLASWIVWLPLAVAAFFASDGPGFWSSLGRELQHGRLLYVIVYALAIIVCTFIYTALVVDPSQAAENLARYGGVIPGIAPGEATAEHIDGVLSRTTLLGAIYLAAVCILPEFLISYAQVPFYFGGTALLVVVCTILDIDVQVRSEAATIVELGG